MLQDNIYQGYKGPPVTTTHMNLQKDSPKVISSVRFLCFYKINFKQKPTHIRHCKTFKPTNKTLDHEIIHSTFVCFIKCAKCIVHLEEMFAKAEKS